MIPLTDVTEEVARLESALRSGADTSPQMQFAKVVRAGLAALPLPGGGQTAGRFALLRCAGRHDLSVARLYEGHADALAILAEAGAEAPPAARLGVWAAGPVESLAAVRDGAGWRLEGLRRWCSGAPMLTHALVRAGADDGERLFLVPLGLSGIGSIPGTWPAVGMAGSLTLDVRFTGVEVTAAAAIGPPGFYLSRTGFWFGATGVAAVWLGGAEAVGALVSERAGEDPHRLAHLGAIVARLAALDALLAAVTREIDAAPGGGARVERFARIARAEIEQGATEVIERTGRATGADPLSHDPVHARRVADLSVYLRQSHAEADLAELGSLEQRLHANEGGWPGGDR